MEADLIRPVCELGTFPIVGKALEKTFGLVLLHSVFASVSACLRTVREAGPYGIDGRSCKILDVGVALKSSENYAVSPKIQHAPRVRVLKNARPHGSGRNQHTQKGWIHGRHESVVCFFRQSHGDEQ